MCLGTVMLLPKATVGQTGQFLNKSTFDVRGKSKCTITWNAES